jgi:hypothetical protein
LGGAGLCAQRPARRWLARPARGSARAEPGRGGRPGRAAGAGCKPRGARQLCPLRGALFRLPPSTLPSLHPARPSALTVLTHPIPALAPCPARRRRRPPPQAEEAAAARRAAARAALETGEKVDPSVAADALRGVLAEGEAAAGAALRKLAVEGGLAAKARALVEAMFVDEDGAPDGPAASLKLAAGIKRGAGLLRLVADGAPGQLAALVALEWLCAAGAPERRLKEAPLALKALYDADLADEEIVLAWHGRADAAKALGVDAAGAAAVRKAVQPVVDWLREGEEDSEEEEGEEEEDDDDE